MCFSIGYEYMMKAAQIYRRHTLKITERRKKEKKNIVQHNDNSNSNSTRHTSYMPFVTWFAQHDISFPFVKERWIDEMKIESHASPKTDATW